MGCSRELGNQFSKAAWRPLYLQHCVRSHPASVCQWRYNTGVHILWQIQHLLADRTNSTLLLLCTMQVRKQNLTEICDASAIVQPTNQWLNQAGGVSTAICEAAGPPFKQGCAQLLLEDGGCLPQGMARCSYLEPAQRNRLHCQCVIHAVLPLRSGEAK